MKFLKELFKSKENKISDQDLYFQEVLKSQPVQTLSFLNKRIVMDQRLSLPVAECMLFIEQMHKELIAVDKKYSDKAKSQKQWSELYNACLALMMVRSLQDQVLIDRYYKFTFVPRVKEVIETPYTNAPVTIGPRKSAKVKFLNFANAFCKFQKTDKKDIVQPQTLLEWYAVAKY